MNKTTITAIEQILFALVSAGLTYVTANQANLGQYGPLVVLGLQATQTILNGLLGNPVAKVIGMAFPPKDSK